MQHSISVLRAAAASLLLSALASAGGASWHADFDAAQKEAEKAGKDLLVDFTGSDWCGWCIRLNKEVFDHEAFAAGVKGDFVLVALDFPNGQEARAKVPNPKRNSELRDLHGVNGYPTILLMTAKGEVYGRTGYRQGGPEAYVQHLGELRKTGKQALADVVARVAAFERASGEAKLAAWDQLADLARSLGSESPFSARLTGSLEAAFAFDSPERKLRAVGLLLDLGRAGERTLRMVRELDPKNEQGLLERTVALKFAQVQDEAGARAAVSALTEFETGAKFKDTELAASLYGTAAVWFSDALDDAEAAKTWAKKAQALDPKDEGVRAAIAKILGG